MTHCRRNIKSNILIAAETIFGKYNESAVVTILRVLQGGMNWQYILKRWIHEQDMNEKNWWKEFGLIRLIDEAKRDV